MKLPSEDTRIGLSIALSAILYLFSYASNITTIVEYFHVGKHNPSMVGVFGASVAFLSFGHMINALIFKLKLGRGNHPVKAAYFFPLIQLSRLVKVVRRTFEFKGFKSLESEEKSTLFTVATLALDTAPLLYLQFVMFFVKYAQGRASRITLLSLVASFIAVTYNGGVSILSAAKFAKRLREKAVIFAAGGINTFVCIFLRCTTFAATIIWKGWIGPPSFIALVLLVNLVIFWKVYVGAGIWKRLGQTFSAAYVSLCIGPMYAAVSEGFSNKLLLPNEASRGGSSLFITLYMIS